MGSIHVLGPVHEEPLIELVGEPALPERLRRELEASRQALLDHPDHFDGPQLILLEVSPERVLGYQGSYAHYRAIQRLGPETALGLGSAGIGLCLADEQGRELWVKRASVVDNPSSWCYAAGGGVADAALGFRGAALAEASEELGLVPEQLRDLSPRVLLGNQRGDAAYLVFSALLDPEAEIALNEQEAVAWRWVREPLEELAVSAVLRELYLCARPYLPWQRGEADGEG